MDRWFQRDVDLDYAHKCLNTLPLAIVKQNFNLFKLLYPHNIKKTLDLAIIIGISDFQEIEIVTIIEVDIKKRIR